MSLKDRIQAVVDDDRGVSPVIGVILMVAITVILAAVIGTFVLGLGDSLQQAPQSQLSAEVTGDSPETLEISHNGGDSINAGDIRITVQGESDDFTNGTGFSLSDGEFNVGDTISINEGGGSNEINDSLSGDKRVRLIHGPSESILLDTEVTFST